MSPMGHRSKLVMPKGRQSAYRVDNRHISRVLLRALGSNIFFPTLLGTSRCAMQCTQVTLQLRKAQSSELVPGKIMYIIFG